MDNTILPETVEMFGCYVNVPADTTEIFVSSSAWTVGGIVAFDGKNFLVGNNKLIKITMADLTDTNRNNADMITTKTVTLTGANSKIEGTVGDPTANGTWTSRPGTPNAKERPGPSSGALLCVNQSMYPGPIV